MDRKPCFLPSCSETGCVLLHHPGKLLFSQRCHWDHGHLGPRPSGTSTGALSLNADVGKNPTEQLQGSWHPQQDFDWISEP
ncbi:hypothetical protein MATL_G00081380 [Megalops atlanticus]|uniref:Uncharacterized protein n=1 Tax=Megalops atlanticus TaxID=7932 RepID=A0A9D3Q7E2_MEGAT|nr:hypothetical protein MATL_G00081380 [Megalops atlanticus]